MKDSTVAGDIRTRRKQRALHQSRLEVITPDEHGYLPLHYAAAYEQPDAAKQLLDNPQLQPTDAEKQSMTANGNGELSAHLCAKYARFAQKQFVDDNPYLKWCPAPGCASCSLCCPSRGSGAPPPALSP